MLPLYKSYNNNYVRQLISKINYSFKKNKCGPKGPPWRILFFGTDQFAMKSLQPLCSKLRTGTLISSLGVVTKANSVIKSFANSEKLPCYTWPPDINEIKNYDLGVVVSFGHLISESIIKTLPLGCINVHASVLPKLRGAAPIIHCILNGENESGVTIMKIHPHRFDTGEIVRQYRISVGPRETVEELEERLGSYGSQLLMECIRDLPKCVQYATQQPKDGVSYAPKVQKSMAVVNWDEMTAMQVYNRFRALNHLYQLKTNWHGIGVKLLEVRLLEQEHKSSSSATSALDFLDGKENVNKQHCDKSSWIEFDKERKELRVICSDCNKIAVNKLKIGGKVMSAMDFYNGFLTKKPKNEWKFINR